MPEQSSPRTAVTCSNCGESLHVDDQACRSCGAAVRPCGRCGAGLVAADRTCPRCGALVDAARVTMLTGGRPSGPVVPSPWAAVLERLREVTAGEYDIGYELGRGGMAAVFLAYDLALARHVAIKVMSPALLMGEGMVARFRQEARTIANLSHPGIITIYAVRQLADLHFFVMRFVEGRALEHVLAITPPGTMPIAVVRCVLQQVGSALAYAHRKGVIHRDIKPANILVDVDGNALVADFGIAKVTESSTHTQTGLVVGTPAYISPEQCMGQTIGGFSDQYALGIVGYELLTGYPPFSGTGFAILQAHTMQPPRPIRELRPDCPPELESALLRMLAKRPEDRFGSMVEAIDAIGATTAGEEESARAFLAARALPDETLRRRLAGPESPVPVGKKRQSAATLVVPDLPSDRVLVGTRVRLTASAIDANGWIIERQPTWTSSDERVATVSTDGDVTALAPGAVTIVARLGALEARVPMVVEGRPLAQVTNPPVAVEPEASSGDVPMTEVGVSSATTADTPVAAAPPLGVPMDDASVEHVPAEAREDEPSLADASAAGPTLIVPAARLGVPDDATTTAASDPLLATFGGQRTSAPITSAEVSITDGAADAGESHERGADSEAEAPGTGSLEGTSPDDRDAAVAVPALASARDSWRRLVADPRLRRAAPWAGGAALVALVAWAGVALATRGDPIDEPTVVAAGEPVDRAADSVRATRLADSVRAADSTRADSIGAAARDSAARALAPAPVASVAVSGPPTLAVGEFARLRTSVRDTRGELVRRRAVKWTSETPSIATVDTFGNVQGRAPGEAVIVAAIEGRSGRLTLRIAALAGSGSTASADSTRGAAGGYGSGEADASRLGARAEECVAVLQSFDPEPIERYYGPYNSNARRLVNALATIASLRMTIASTRDPRVNGDQGSAEFSGSLSGRRTNGKDWGPVEATIVADFRRGAQGWELKRCWISRLGNL